MTHTQGMGSIERARARDVQLSSFVSATGGVVKTASLIAAGYTYDEMRGALDRTAITRVRKGWVAAPDAAANVLAAVRWGGRLGCVSALEHHGLWVPPHSSIHLALPRHSSVVVPPHITAHRQSSPWRESGRAVDSLLGSIKSVAKCCDFDIAVAVVDSALNRRKTPPDALISMLRAFPAGRRIVEDLDAQSASGLESLCRLSLQRHGVTVRSQVNIASVGRVDFVVGDRLIVEADGREFHESTEAFYGDRARLLAASVRGYETIRPTAQQIVHEPDWLTMAVRRKIARGDHVWSARHRRDPMCDGFAGGTLG